MMQDATEFGVWTAAGAAVPAHELRTLPRLDQGTDGDAGTGVVEGAGDGEAGGMLARVPIGDYLIVGGILVACVVLLRHLTKQKKRAAQRDEATATPGERIEAIRERATAGREPIERFMSEAEAFTRRMSATLDTKAARLEVLIEQAEEAIARLEAARTETRSDAEANATERGPTRRTGLGTVGAAHDVEAAEAAPAGGTPFPSTDDAANRNASTRTGRIDPSVLDRARLDQLRRERNGAGSPGGASARSARSEGIGIARGAAGPADARTHDAGVTDAARSGGLVRRGPGPSREDAGAGKLPSGREAVFALADRGAGASEIARELGRPVGEVELMLRLRRT